MTHEQIVWTIDDEKRALAEGWLIARNVGGDRDGVVEIQRDDEAAVFRGDAHAVSHVLLRADQDPLYRKALDYVMQEALVDS